MGHRISSGAGIWFGLLAVWSLACSGGAKHVQRGDELAKSGLHAEALEAYELAAKVDPDDAAIQARILATQQQLGAAANAQGLELLAGNNALGAVQAFKRALVQRPDDPTFQQNLKKAALHQMAQGNQAVEQKKFQEAVSIFEALMAELPRLKQAQQGRNDARLAWSETLLQKAVDLQERGLHGGALLHLIRIRSLTGAYGDSAEREAESRRQLSMAARFGFQARPAKVKRALVAGTARLVQRLQQMELKECAASSVSRAPRVVLTAGLEGLEFIQQQRQETGKQKYQSGTRPVDNPAFLETEQKIEQTRQKISDLEGAIQTELKQLEQVRQAFADSGPDDDEAALRARVKQTEQALATHRAELAQKQDQAVALRATLSKTPRKLDEPVFDTHEYAILEVTRTARLRMLLSARSDEGQVLIRSAGIEGSASTSDKTQRAEPRYGVKADPLEFPKSDEELSDAAADEAVSGAAERLQDLCKRWQGDILERARQAKSGAELEAVEDYVLYLFVAPGPPPADLVQFLNEKLGFTAIEQVRGPAKS
jgi:tetratricopeptide (TPR) repeat protein